MTQERIQKTKAKTERSQDEAPAETKTESTDVEKLKSDIDGILDEIDTILDSEAQAMVSSYVQKGGQ